MSDSSAVSPVPQTDVAAPGPRRRLRRSWFERFVLLLGALSCVLAAASAGVLAWGLDKWNQIETVELTVAGPAASGEPSNWLLVGSDSRVGIDDDHPYAGYILGEGVPEGKRTDTIMVARVDPEGGVIHLLSLPRDLYVSYPDGGEGRINAAFNGEDGAQRLLETVELNFGIEINHYAEINFSGFEDVVDAIGGVPIWFDRPMRDSGSGLNVQNAGCQVLSGADALAFARSRHLEYFEDGAWRTDGTGDLGRNSRQQYFLRRVAATAVSELDITDIGTINRVLDAGGQNLAKDQTVSPEDLLGLARFFHNLGDEQIIGHSLPVYDFRASNGAAVLGLETEQATPVLAVFRGDAPQAATPTTEPAVYQVLNGSRIAGQAGAVSDSLAGRGLELVAADNSEPIAVTTIRYGSGQEAAATALAAHLTTDPLYELVEGLPAVQLVTGADFADLAPSPRDDVVGPDGAEAAESAAGDTGDTASVELAGADTSQETVGVVPAASPEGTACE